MKKNNVQRKCFKLIIDGKAFGPYLDSYRHRVAYMEHKIGAKFETVYLKEGWLPWIKAPARKEKIDTSTPLFDGIDFRPTPKQNV